MTIIVSMVDTGRVHRRKMVVSLTNRVDFKRI